MQNEEVGSGRCEEKINRRKTDEKKKDNFNLSQDSYNNVKSKVYRLCKKTMMISLDNLFDYRNDLIINNSNADIIGSKNYNRFVILMLISKVEKMTN